MQTIRFVSVRMLLAAASVVALLFLVACGEECHSKSHGDTCSKGICERKQ